MMRPLADSEPAHVRFVAVSFVAALLASSCDPPARGGAPSPDAASLAAGGSDAGAPPDSPPPGPPSIEEERALAEANAAFAVDVLATPRGTRTVEQNLAFSPLSVSTAIGMLAGGARGETAAQIAGVLHLGSSPARAAEIAGGVASAVARRQPDTRFANGLFGDDAYSFEPSYLSRTKAAFGTSLLPVGFAARPDEARGTINTWVAAHTGGRIHDLLPPGSVNPSTRLLVANAIDFSARWATPFDKAATASAPFRVAAPAPPVPVTMMHADVEAPFAAADGAKVLDLRFAGDPTAMTFVLPDRADGLTALEAKIDAPTLTRWLGGSTPQPVICAIPKFDIAPAEPMDLTTTLEGLGMGLAFDRGQADFRGIARSSDPGRRLYLGAVVHAAAVTIDEEGARATATTAVSGLSAAPAPGQKRRSFVADHPFLFFIRDVASGAILFAGRVVNPARR